MSVLQPTHIIIFGGGGDLAQRKLLPALFDLYIQNRLPKVFAITGLARTHRSNEEYRALVRDAIIRKYPMQGHDAIAVFCKNITYVTGSFTDAASYTLLAESNSKFDQNIGMYCNKLFYLAVPPEHYQTLFTLLHDSGIATRGGEGTGWTRILVEKPFGNDYKTAQELDQTLSLLFAEEQIFRIDHYLAKEAVQNILSFRFANILLKSPWNKEYIKEVHITMHESIDVGTRGAFYDGVGALRDVGQNHLLQILALIAMDEPHHLTAKQIRSHRAKILEKLIPIDEKTVTTSVVRAQYDGYKGTPGVAENSNTETYFEFKAFIDSDTWRDVPFYISAGKALRESKVCVEIVFHDVATGPFDTKASLTVGNTILLSISPTEAMRITLNVKKPGFGYQIESHTLAYTWENSVEVPADAYQTVLLDCIEGDQTLFTQTNEVLASWKFITSIMDQWHNIPLHIYAKGSGELEETLINHNK